MLKNGGNVKLSIETKIIRIIIIVESDQRRERKRVTRGRLTTLSQVSPILLKNVHDDESI